MTRDAFSKLSTSVLQGTPSLASRRKPQRVAPVRARLRRSLQMLIGCVVRALGAEIDRPPAHVQRAFHRGARIVVAYGSSPNCRRVEWSL